MTKTLSNLSEGDKVWIYDYQGNVSELEVKSVGPINECGYFLVCFKETSLYDIRLYKNAEYFWLEEHWIYFTIGNLERMFWKIYETGQKNMQYRVKEILGFYED